MKLDLRIVVVGEMGLRGMVVDVTRLTPAALRVLGSIEPEITEPQFYARPLKDRIVEVTRQAVLERCGSPHRRVQMYGLVPLPPEIGMDEMPEDPRLAGTADEDALCVWMDRAAVKATEAEGRRLKRGKGMAAAMDRDIGRWVGELARQASVDPERAVRLFRSGDEVTGWRFQTDDVPIAGTARQKLALLRRIEDLAVKEGRSGLQDWLLSRPELAHLRLWAEAQKRREHADDERGMAVAMR